jgi:hypothetical protein
VLCVCSYEAGCVLCAVCSVFARMRLDMCCVFALMRLGIFVC